MKTLRTGRMAAGWTLVLAGALLVGMGPTVRADASTASAQKSQGAFFPQTATVKIDTAMLQERAVGADGSIHTETYLDALPTQSAKIVAPTVEKPQAVAKA